MSAALTGADFNDTARFIAATAAHVRSLSADQRHDAARRVVQGLRRLASAIRASQADHGFCADLVLADGLALIDAVEAEVLA